MLFYNDINLFYDFTMWCEIILGYRSRTVTQVEQAHCVFHLIREGRPQLGSHGINNCAHSKSCDLRAQCPPVHQ